MTVDELVTPRLLLRLLGPEDVEAFAAYRRHPDVARYQSWDSDYSRADAERLVAGQADARFAEPDRWIQVAAADRSTGELCGDCAVHVFTAPPRTAEVGVTFAPGTQGRGLATEALGAVVTQLFEGHGLHRVYARADDRNRAVHRLLERLGFRYEETRVEPDWTCRVYAITR